MVNYLRKKKTPEEVDKFEKSLNQYWDSLFDFHLLFIHIFSN